ncbi:MAG: hypothetical protein WDN69_05030 [Aliidongia sp.]
MPVNAFGQRCHDDPAIRQAPAAAPIARHANTNRQVLHDKSPTPRNLEPGGTARQRSRSSVTTARLRPRRFEPEPEGGRPGDDRSIPLGFSVGRGGKPFRRRISSFNTTFSARRPASSGRSSTIRSSSSLTDGVRISAGSSISKQNRTHTKTASVFNPKAQSHNVALATGFAPVTEDLIKLAHNAQHFEPGDLAKYADTLTRASMFIPDATSALGNALKYSGAVMKNELGMSDKDVILANALANRLGFSGTRGGTNLVNALSRTIPGVFGSGLLTGKSGEALHAMGMADNKGH